MERQTVILAKICAIYDNKAFVIQKDSQFKKIYKCADLMKYYTANSKYLIPYYINEGYAHTFMNPNEQYDVFKGLDNTFSELLYNGDDEKIGALLKELGENIPINIFKEEDEESSVRKKLNELKSLYELVGYHLIEHEDGFSVEPYLMQGDRFSDMSKVEMWMENSCEGVFGAYKGAMDAFASNNYGTCIEACRTVLTGIFSKYRGTDAFAKWTRGVAILSNEMTDPKELKNYINSTGKEDLAAFFEENTNGKYTKTRAIYTIYSMMSDYGTHREEGSVEKPTRADALMMLRMMQDIVLWVYQTKVKP